jgi:AraC-like DNA-binding protein
VNEVFHAHFVDHCYPPHVHDTWTVLFVDAGAVRYDLEHRHRGSDATAVTILPAHVAHDGRSATASGIRKRVLYVDTNVLPETLIGAAVDRPAISDEDLIADLPSCTDTSSTQTISTRAKGCSTRSRGRFVHGSRVPHLHCQGPTPAPRCASARRWDAHVFEPVTLTDTPAVGLSVGPASRAFKQTFGLSPHAYVVRVDRARRLVLDGATVVDAAVAAGFHDQAHLARQLRHHTGTTPARFSRQVTLIHARRRTRKPSSFGGSGPNALSRVGPSALKGFAMPRTAFTYRQCEWPVRH